MKMNCLLLMIAVWITFPIQLFAQEEQQDTIQKVAIEKLTYKQQPGLAIAASKIYFSEKRYSISGFGEVNYVNYTGEKDISSGDIELYYTNLYRYATFFGYRITPKIIWNSELQIEYLHDGIREGHAEIVFEAFTDFIIHDKFKARVGYYPLSLGYVNNNDEPIMFYSVNRSDVERLIMPSTWIELGAMFYGNINDDLSYSLGIAQGLNARNYIGGTWIRQGRQVDFSVPEAIAIVPQLNYNGFKNLELSVSGYFGNSGRNETIETGDESKKLKAPVTLYSGFARYEKGNMRFVTVGNYGTLGQTEDIYNINGSESNRIMGKEVFGYLFEFGYDILPFLRGEQSHTTTTHNADDEKGLFVKHEMKLPLFVRYERLNTHHSVTQRLDMLPRLENNLHIITSGVNFKTKENIVIKLDYQWRINARDPKIKESDLIEMGLGFIF